MEISRGALVLVFDPVRPDGSGSGVRGLHLIDSVDEHEVIARPVDRLDQHVRLPLKAVRMSWRASFVSEEFLK